MLTSLVFLLCSDLEHFSSNLQVQPPYVFASVCMMSMHMLHVTGLPS